MPRSSFRSRILGLAAAGAIALVAGRAAAAELEVSLVESDDGVTVRLTGFDGEVVEPRQVVTSRTGALLFVAGQTAPTARIKPEGQHRLQFVQIGRAGDRLALKLAQRDRTRGSLVKHLSHHARDGALEIEVRDSDAPTVPAALPATNEIEDAEARAATLAALEANLGPSKELGAAPADPRPPKATEDREETEEETSAPTTDEPDPEDTAVAGLTADPEEPAGHQRPMAPLLAAFGVLALLAVGAFWLRRRRRIPDGEPVLRVVSRMAIGPRQQVVWMRAGSRELLVGATEHGISLLTEIDAAAAGATALLGAAPPRRGPTGTQEVPRIDPQAEVKVAAFKARLQEALGRELAGGAPAEAAAAPPTMPPHLQLLSGDPEWTRGEGVA